MHRFCCKMKNKNRRVAWHCHCMHCHYFVVISVLSSATGFYGDEIRIFGKHCFFVVMIFLYFAFFLLHAPDILDNIQICLVNLICFSDNIQIFLVNLICFSDKLQIFLQHILKKMQHILNKMQHIYKKIDVAHFFGGAHCIFSQDSIYFFRQIWGFLVGYIPFFDTF